MTIEIAKNSVRCSAYYWQMDRNFERSAIEVVVRIEGL